MVADMGADMEVHMVADMEVDKVADMSLLILLSQFVKIPLRKVTKRLWLEKGKMINRGQHVR